MTDVLLSPYGMVALAAGIAAGWFAAWWLFPVGYFVVATVAVGIGRAGMGGDGSEAALQPLIGLYLLWIVLVLAPSLGGAIGQFFRYDAARRKRSAPPAL